MIFQKLPLGSHIYLEFFFSFLAYDISKNQTNNLLPCVLRLLPLHTKVTCNFTSEIFL
jgi:hypothetical protein